MSRAIRGLGVVALAALAACAPRVNPDADREDWVQLFDGESLEGWVPKIRGEAAGVRQPPDLPGDEWRSSGGLPGVRRCV